MRILDPLPNDKILSLLLTLQCTAECAHCGTSSGPKVKGRLPLQKALQAIDQAVGNGYKLVVFTGGEPLLYGRELLELIANATEKGLSTRVVTNAFWATTLVAADDIAQKLENSGLREINFSTGDEHARFVPIENVLRAAAVCLNRNIPVSIMIETVQDNRVSRQSLLENPMFAELFADSCGELINFCESPWMPLSASEVFKYPCGFAVNQGNVKSKVGCDSIINTTTVLPDGRIMACCGLGTQSIPELEVGQLDCDDFAAISKRLNEDFLKRWIKIEGAERILAWAAEKDPSIQWENMYAHRCQACKRIYSDPKIRQVIFAYHEEKIVDILFQEWLLFHYNTENNSAAQSATSSARERAGPTITT